MRDTLYIFLQVVRRDLQINLRHKSECFGVILFYIIIVTLFPLVLGQFTATQLWLVPCILWIAALLTTILAQENVLRTDFQLGIYEQFILSKHPLSALMLAKSLANWLLTGLPLIIVTPLLALSFDLPSSNIMDITYSLLLGTPTLSLLAAIAAALTVTLPGGGVMLALLLLPLYVPILVIGASVGILSLQGIACNGQLALLAALSVLALMLAPIAVSATIKVSTT